LIRTMKNPSRRLFHVSATFILKTFMRIEREGWRSALKNSAFIIAANHRTYIDPLIVNAALGAPLPWIGASFMQDIPIIRTLSRLAGTVFIATNGRNSVQKLLAALDSSSQHKSIGIFPEGFLPLVDQQPAFPLRPFHRGFAFLSTRLQKPVLPVTIVPFREKTAPYPFPISIRKLLIPHAEFCDLETRVAIRHAKVIFHEPVNPPPPGAGRAELIYFTDQVRSIIEAPLTNLQTIGEVLA